MRACMVALALTMAGVDETFSPWHMLCTGFMFMKSNDVRRLGDGMRLAI